ncbi:MAG: metal-binding protein [Candidatus Niyogibacteria bacterium CG10_big_fil_rev_8_21_14_0_10_46_36]|uniref:Metal-binding protein n=1 Tax=Candidatus Niyogibacteria bacterium CG10_big_fil_rev_8_21_14_0_10_46_36 TaxID=1974726 RepID=A0A2H0TD53_9BACT|nr:MAG: metal-binding protein [Candidatus Niyogibacteria bacterium CG10_big_fil_rev_8_21_14_0_10_46_36]
MRENPVKKKKRYKILKNGKFIESTTPGKYAGWAPRKIFGRMDCESGMRMLKKNRVFLHTYEETIAQDYHSCKKCRPTPDDAY